MKPKGIQPRSGHPGRVERDRRRGTTFLGDSDRFTQLLMHPCDFFFA